MCGDGPDLTPGIDNDDVSEEKGNALTEGIPHSDGEEQLNLNTADKPYLEAFDGRHFPDVFNAVKTITSDSPPSDADQTWRDVGNQLHTLAGNFEREIERLKAAGGWKGKTIEAAYDNAIESINEPFYTGTAALRAAELTHKWRDVVQFVVDKLVNDPRGEFSTLLERYHHDLDEPTAVTYTTPHYSETRYEPKTEAEKAEIRQHYDEYMRIVMNDSYRPGITDIYGKYPHFVASNAPPQEINIPGLPEGPGKPNDESGGSRSTGDGGGTPSFDRGGGGTPSIPKNPGPSLPTGLPDQTRLPSPGDSLPSPGDSNNPGQSNGQGQDGQRPSPTDPSQAMGQAGGLANAANQAMGAATQAASQAAKAPQSGLPKDLPKKPNVPEGALRLGKEGQGSGARGGGGGGASLGGAPKGLPSGLPGMPAAATQATAAGASGPGMGAGAPMMGPPGSPGAAGHGAGGAQQGKEHKASKALRSRRHGVEIAGEAEAVVPVVGQDQDDDQQQDEAAAQRRADPSRRPSPPSPPAAPVSAAEQERRQLRGRG